ncbi:MAG: response regulator [Deltaproteobacteria bacterium]|nr:MAG: response regulator [Deltaproteobacteria bacterium]
MPVPEGARGPRRPARGGRPPGRGVAFGDADRRRSTRCARRGARALRAVVPPRARGRLDRARSQVRSDVRDTGRPVADARGPPRSDRGRGGDAEFRQPGPRDRPRCARSHVGARLRPLGPGAWRAIHHAVRPPVPAHGRADPLLGAARRASRPARAQDPRGTPRTHCAQCEPADVHVDGPRAHGSAAGHGHGGGRDVRGGPRSHPGRGAPGRRRRDHRLRIGPARRVRNGGGARRVRAGRGGAAAGADPSGRRCEDDHGCFRCWPYRRRTPRAHGAQPPRSARSRGRGPVRQQRVLPRRHAPVRSTGSHRSTRAGESSPVSKRRCHRIAKRPGSGPGDADRHPAFHGGARPGPVRRGCRLNRPVGRGRLDAAVPEQNILVIEDDPSVRLLLQKSLSAKGYSVEVVEDGLEGLKRLEEGDAPDLIIVDIMMPRLDGMTFVKAIKRHEDTRPIPVIFLTAKNDPKTMIEGINVGAKFYVTKPFQFDELLKKVEKALG